MNKVRLAVTYTTLLTDFYSASKSKYIAVFVSVNQILNTTIKWIYLEMHTAVK